MWSSLMAYVYWQFILPDYIWMAGWSLTFKGINHVKLSCTFMKSCHYPLAETLFLLWLWLYTLQFLILLSYHLYVFKLNLHIRLQYSDSGNDIWGGGPKHLHIQITEISVLFLASFYLWIPFNLLPLVNRWGPEFWWKFPFWAFIAEMSAWRETSKHGFLCSENMASFVNFTLSPYQTYLSQEPRQQTLRNKVETLFLFTFFLPFFHFLKRRWCRKCSLSCWLLLCSSEDFRSWDQPLSSHP